MKPMELPGNWEATPGERGKGRYTKFFHNPETGEELRQYTDPGEHHKVVVSDNDGYPVHVATFDTEEKADKGRKSIMKARKADI